MAGILLQIYLKRNNDALVENHIKTNLRGDDESERLIKMKQTISVITYCYPNDAMPTACTFIQELVNQWRKNGYKVQVINPLTFKNYWKNKKMIRSGNDLFPYYCSFNILKVLRPLRELQVKLADYSFKRAVEKCLSQEGEQILYTHFLNAGFCAAALAEKYGYRAYCAFGESTLWSIAYKDRAEVIRRMQVLNGFISVSTKNTQELISGGFAPADKIVTLPNGVDRNAFQQLDKRICRKKLGFPEDQVIGIYVGHFNDRKGVLRVNAATKDVPGLKMVFVGSGEQMPKANNILFIGRVEHSLLPEYLSAADFFILPTKAEGCCNAILEAMSCGLPIISSKGEFNDDILDDDFSIRVEPLDVQALRAAVCKLVDDYDERSRMSKLALARSKAFSIERRAESIAAFVGAER